MKKKINKESGGGTKGKGKKKNKRGNGRSTACGTGACAILGLFSRSGDLLDVRTGHGRPVSVVSNRPGRFEVRRADWSGWVWGSVEGMHSLFLILYSLFFILYSLFFILYSLFFILYSLFFILLYYYNNNYYYYYITDRILF